MRSRLLVAWSYWGGQLQALKPDLIAILNG